MTGMQANYVQRLRLVFSKGGPTRYIGHLDLARTLERSLNRSRIPLAYTQGFNKRPRMQLADALPLGYTSDAEIADIWLSEAIDVGDARRRIQARMAPGLDIMSVEEVPIADPALQTRTLSATYEVTLLDEVERAWLEARVRGFLASKTCPAERGGKSYDLRPLVFELRVVSGQEDYQRLMVTVALRPGNTGRPDEVLRALGIDPDATGIHRKRLELAEGSGDG
jgi:radical SAM-linked protein